VQVAFVSGNTYTFVQFFAAGLFLYSGSSAVIGYYPSNGMVRPCVYLCVCVLKESFFSMTNARICDISFFADWLSCVAAIVHVWRSADYLCFSQCVSTEDSGKSGKDRGLVAGFRFSHSSHAHNASAACWLKSVWLYC